MGAKLNLGCGFNNPAGWINVDASIGAKLAKVPLVQSVGRHLGLFKSGKWNRDILLADLTRPLPFTDSSAEVAYSSHTLEHMSRESGGLFLKECFRVLRVGGIIRIVVPDLAEVLKAYSDGRLDSRDILDRLGSTFPTRKLLLRSLLDRLIFYPHVCIYDRKSLADALQSAGFTEVREMAPGKSRLSRVDEVETREITQNSLIFEGTKT